ncbi:MAG: rod shape-determining protein RodA [Acidobacteriota bacterium]
MIRRRLLEFDYLLVLLALALSVVGLVGIYSATTHGADSGLFRRQVIWLALGLGACLVVSLLDYRFLADHAFMLYGAILLTLTGVLFFGTEVHGSKSWIRFGELGVQPSEMAKIVLVLALARYVSELNQNLLRRKHLLILGAMTLGPAILVILQGDSGTALSFLPILLGVIFVAGLKQRFLIGVLVGVLCLAPIGWFALRDYQKQRIMVVLDPALDPDGVGYQTRQSLIAIGSGGLTGKGLGQGLQSQLGFVPEIHTDFIFSLLAEEQGFIGGALTLVLYLLLLLRLQRIGETARGRLGILVVAGFTSLICFHVFVNVGMTLGIMPAIGIPLPFLSYGGSSTLSSFIGLGLALSVHSRRFVYS